MFPGHFSHLARLVPVDGRFRWLHVRRRASLNFNEAKDISVSSDQVNFTPTTRRPKVARHHHIAEPTQVKVSVFFSSSPNVQMSRGFVRWEQPVRQPFPDAEPRSCASSGKHVEQSRSLRSELQTRMRFCAHPIEIDRGHSGE
jgi:hypothetical protein